MVETTQAEMAEGRNDSCSDAIPLLMQWYPTQNQNYLQVIRMNDTHL